MTDAAEKALAEALHENHVGCHANPKGDRDCLDVIWHPTFSPWHSPAATAILAHPFTESERRALAAHFLTAEALAEALAAAFPVKRMDGTLKPPAESMGWAKVILAALRGASPVPPALPPSDPNLMNWKPKRGAS